MSETEVPDETDAARRGAIVYLIDAYASAIDTQRFDDVAALFATDGVLRVYDRPKGEARGRAEIARLASRLIGAFAATLHEVSHTSIIFTGPDDAVATSSLRAWHRFAADRPDGILWGTYRDEFTRRDGHWAILCRTLIVARHQDFDFPWITAESEGPHP